MLSPEILYQLGVLRFLNNSVWSQTEIKINTLQNPVKINGKIDSLEWPEFNLNKQFVRLETDRRAIATRKTELIVGQFQNELFFLFVCHIKLKDEVSARIQRRDQVRSSDDLIALILDTYNDKRNSLLFQVNPLGTLTDAKVTDEGKNVDFNLDTQWQAEVGIYDDRWIAEIRINLDDIQFSPRSTTWDVNFGRIIRTNMETC